MFCCRMNTVRVTVNQKLVGPCGWVPEERYHTGHNEPLLLALFALFVVLCSDVSATGGMYVHPKSSSLDEHGKVDTLLRCYSS